jgi:UDP-glucose 4-epimerase
VIPIFVRKALAGEPVTIAGEGLQSRRFVYVEDLADGVVRGLGAQAGGRVYNLVGGESVTVRAIADAVGDLLGGVEIVHTHARAADFAGAEVSGARAAAELGWRPATSFSEGLRRYVEWHRRDAAAPAAPAPRQAARLRHRPRLTPRLASLVLSWLTVFAVAGGLAAYMASIRAVGLTAASDRTIAVLSISTLAGYLATALDGPRRALWTFSGWALAAAGLVIVYMSEFREVLGLAGPDESRVLLGLAGGALAIAIADAGLRLRRTGEERLAADRV